MNSPPSITEPRNSLADDEVIRHVQDNLTSELFANFALFVYIDKAEMGPFAQRMYVLRKTASETLEVLYDWPVSTGRGAIEHDAHGHVQSTFTPRGYFEFDPKRMFADHVSGQWGEAMPYAMFFDWAPYGHATGLAIHGTPDADALGQPASAGCPRLALGEAQTLFDLVQSQYRAPVPKLAYLDGADGVSSEGFLMHDQQGNLQMTDGYSVLVLIDNFGGDDSQVSSLW